LLANDHDRVLIEDRRGGRNRWIPYRGIYTLVICPTLLSRRMGRLSRQDTVARSQQNS
jgi:hypothetical protein